MSSGAIGDAEEGRDAGTSTRGGDSSNDDQELGPLRVQPSSRTASGSGTTVYTDQAKIPPNFVELGPDNPWLVCRSPDHGGKLFWLHRTTQETTWRQPLPRLKLIPSPVFVTHLDGRPQLVDCNGPIRARRAEMGAADGLVGAPPPLHHALLQVVARDDACEFHIRAEDQQMA